ncbi:hypothetical protein [Tenacibaculum amylolyticum]|uniref:hypothetical protein n=1 Tax=Tenacibaculum amylolyticum TaxID=104269 RepID=UPI0038946800
MKNFKNFSYIILGGLMFGSLFSCQKEELDIDISDPILHRQNYSKASNSSEMTKLGEKLKNPYSVENMKKAWESLKEKTKVSQNIEIKTTHYYVKFTPKNEEELSLLKSDKSLILFDRPLDYEIKQQGNYYHDPEIPTEQPTYQYASIPVGNKLPEKIHFEILEKLFIPDEDSETNPLKSDGTIEQLVDESLKLTGNLDENAPMETWFSKWKPAGKIQVWDNALNRHIPLHGIQVYAVRWFTAYTGKTDANGNFSCNGNFRHRANYFFRWETNDFRIGSEIVKFKESFFYRKSNFPKGGFRLNGPNKKGDWNLNIQNGKDRIHGTIYRALYHYHYGNIKNLRRPIYGSNTIGIIEISDYNTVPNNTSELYAETINSIVRIVHADMNPNIYNNISAKMSLSWAKGVEWELTRMVYPNYQATYNNDNITGIVQDMIDPIQQPYDKVAGYTIRQLEDAINGQTTWRGWRDAIINSYNNPYELNLHNYQFTVWKFK